MVVIKKIFRFVEDLWLEHSLSKQLSKMEKDRKAAAQEKKESPSIESSQASTHLQNKVIEEQPSDVDESPSPSFAQMEIVSTTDPQIEILVDGDSFQNRDRDAFEERHDLLRRQIEAGRENVFNMIGKIRSFNGAAVPLSKVGEAYGEFGPQGFLQRLEEARARTRERAVSRIKMEKKL